MKGASTVPQRYSGVKELRKSQKRRLHNLDIKTDLKKTIKTFVVSVENNKKDEAASNLNTVYKKLDKAAKRNILTKNTASRRKAKFSRILAKLA
ncbi:MAG: 30S ribosomal protein S20 [Candidatus Omnitrophica bacterium]|nr:30S ribosomal protein S20 [Candidatus Omnitrophota bacterium]